MALSRRDFLKFSGATAAGVAVGGRALDLGAVESAQLIYVKDNKIIDIEGDPSTPHTEGALCPKGSSTYQLSINERRLTKGMYRAPGSDKWEEKPLDWMMEQITQRVKKTRDETFVEKAKV